MCVCVCACTCMHACMHACMREREGEKSQIHVEKHCTVLYGGMLNKIMLRQFYSALDLC